MRTGIQNELVVCWDCVIVYQSRDHCGFLFNFRELLVEESELQVLLKSRRVRSETVTACQWLLPPVWPVPSLLRQPTGRYFIDNIVFYDLAGSEGRPLSQRLVLPHVWLSIFAESPRGRDLSRLFRRNLTAHRMVLGMLVYIQANGFLDVLFRHIWVKYVWVKSTLVIWRYFWKVKVIVKISHDLNCGMGYLLKMCICWRTPVMTVQAHNLEPWLWDVEKMVIKYSFLAYFFPYFIDLVKLTLQEISRLTEMIAISTDFK